MAETAGGKPLAKVVPKVPNHFSLVPSGVLSVLPGFGETAQLLAQNPLVRKVDVTVSEACAIVDYRLAYNTTTGWNTNWPSSR
jgi:hypothetical protein